MTPSARAFRTTGLVATVALLLSYAGGCATTEEVEPGLGLGGFATGTGGTVNTGGFPPITTGGTFANTGGAKATTGGIAATGGNTATGGTVGKGGGVSTGGVASGGTIATSTGGAPGGSAGAAGSTAGGKAGAGGVGGGSAGSSAGSGGASDGCNWAACAQEQCSIACPTNMGTYCAMACADIIACVRANPTCGTTADPLCVKRSVGSGTANVCTAQWESASGSASPPGAPARVATDYYACACGKGGPSAGTGGATSTGGKSGTGGAAGNGGVGGKGT